MDVTLLWGDVNASGPLFHDITQTSCGQAYWRKHDDITHQSDPDRDACGVIWLSPIVPWKSDKLLAISQYVSESCYQYGFEPLISFQYPNHRYAYLMIAIVYDLLDPEDDKKALQLYYRLKAECTRLGYPVYRQSRLDNASESADALLQTIQQTIDPNAIFRCSDSIAINKIVPTEIEKI
jgi:4-cresol dehydrogenase (hydroxylating)